MHILHLSSAKTWRGGEQQIAYLIEELQLKNIQQSVLCVENAPFVEWCKQNQIQHFTYKKRASIDPKIAKQLTRLISQKKITHIHAHDSHAHTYAFLAAIIYRIKIPILVSRRVDFPVKNSLFSRWKYNHKSIRKIICISHNIKKVMESAIKDKTKLIVIHSGVQLNKFSHKKHDTLRTTYQIPSQKKIVGNIAALADHKDYPTFVRTAEILLKQQEDLHFFIIGGDAGEAENIKSLIADKGLEKEIILTGYRNDISEILPELEVLLFTSKEEGLGTTVLDAFDCGVPVIASNAGGIPEMIIHNQTGYLAPIGNAQQLAEGVKLVLNDAALRNKLVKNARKQLENFSSRKMARAVLVVYHTVS